MERKEQINKIREAVLNMMNDIEYVEFGGKHSYKKKSNGKSLAGVTGISGMTGAVDAKQWLAAWGAKEAMKNLGYFDEIVEETEADKIYNKELFDNLEVMLNDIKQMDAKKFLSLLQDSKGASKRKGQAAMDLGKLGHTYLEKYVKSHIRKEQIPEMGVELGEIKQYIQLAINWFEENIDEWVLSEAKIADVDEHEYAGTLDALAFMKDGSLAMVDFKFANHLSPEYYLQTAGYCYPFIKAGIKIDKRIIVRIPKTEFLFEWNKFKHKYEKVKNKFEAKEVPSPMKEDFECFANQRKVERHWNFIKKLK